MRAAGNVSVIDFTHRLMADLDMVQAQDIPSGSRGGGALHFREPMVQSSDDEAFYRSDSPEVFPEGAVFEDD
ncbi:hypothetical protein V6N12_058597 [Hibiscus sabdariffa]|uniref:Uncharacterized protein n=1 Tax=Hibiscus sabdariffa TaxID=183260 RepID=A0ABR2EWN2_9ROSI